MRFYERQEGETAKAFEAFKIYRDLGSERSLRRTAEAYYGSMKNIARVGIWSRENAWVERVAAYDDYMEMIRRDAVDAHERHRGLNTAAREADVQDRLLSVKERLIERLETMANWPLEKKQVTEVKNEDGGEKVEITNIYPAKWSFNTIVRAIEAIDDAPNKIAFTDPSGERQFGEDSEAVRRMMMDIISQPDNGTEDR